WPALVPWGFQPDGSRAPGERLRFVCMGDVPHPYALSGEGETVRMAAAAAVPVHVTLHCEAATCVLLMCGRRSVDTLRAEGHLVLEGDRGLMAAFHQWFQGRELPGHGSCAGVQQAVLCYRGAENSRARIGGPDCAEHWPAGDRQ